tara:strand:- start:4460 stop:5404 length:945 start_codon:yes stop_codon:yes gene_type:complete
MKTITLKNLAVNFGCDIKDFNDKFKKFYNSLNMSYRELSREERDCVILETLRKLQNDKQIIGAPERTKIWFDGWKENLDGFVATKNILEIVPKFIRPNKIVRYNGDFIKPSNRFFERDMARLIQIYCYDRFIKNYGVDNVYEFGCGSSFNLATMALFEDERSSMNFFGSDFVDSSVDLCNELGKHFNLNLTGFHFNMITPNTDIKINENSAAFTFGSIEQLGGQFKNFISYLIDNKPKICFHIEPTVENYNSDNLFDYLQIEFHTKRGYTEGLLPYLQDLESKGTIKIIKNNRFNFGSKFMEGYHLYAWCLNES